MSQRDFRPITIFDNVTPIAITGSTNATPSVVTTSTSHGFATGQRVMIQAHSTNTAINGIFSVVVLSPTTFSLKDEFTLIDTAANGVGTGGFCLLAPQLINSMDFRDCVIEITTSAAATVTFKAAGSTGRIDNQANSVTSPRKSVPNFGATLSTTNPYTFVQVIDLDTGAAVNGVTGIVITSGDIPQKQYEINYNVQTWVAVYPITYTTGSFSVVAILSNNQ